MRTHSRVAAVVACLVSGVTASVGAASEEKVHLTFNGGHDTDPRDGGRPVNLIAAALGVTPEVFRSAFSGVRPAPGGSEPEPAQVQRNKVALLDALGRYGVTNDRLDEVSNYYRYRPGSGETWPTAGATAYAILTDGVVTSVVVTTPGAGYTSAPKVSVPNHPEVVLKAELHFDRDLKKNGSIAAITRDEKAR
jgi:hypothetical protein